MRTANERFAAAVRAGDVESALRADDQLHDVLVRVSGNRPAAATVARYTPLIRRLERRRFSEGGNCVRPACTTSSSTPAPPVTSTRRCGSPPRSARRWPSSPT